MLSRRQFLGVAAGGAAAAAGGALLWSQQVDEQILRGGAAAGPGRSGRVLVVVQMGGGNDALNTLVPAADGRYRDARPNVAVPETDLLALPGTTDVALHPSLAPLVPRWESGQIAALQGVGFLSQTRSHFAASDTWWSASGDPTTGWLGRWLDATADPDAPPDPLRAVALGGGAQALIAERSLSTFVRDPGAFRLLATGAADPQAVVEAFQATAEPVSGDPLVAAAQDAVPATLEAVELLTGVAEDRAAAEQAAGTDGGVAVGEGARGYGTPITDLLATAAGIIELDVGTQVIVVGVDGFDTHADQPARHAALLSDVAGGITGFLDGMEAAGRAEDVLVVTTSEFGRRVAENGSLGTDHGSGGSQLLAGPMVAGQIVGDVDLGALIDGDLVNEIDARSLYAVGLDWLGGADAAEILDEDPDRYGLLRT